MIENGFIIIRCGWVGGWVGGCIYVCVNYNKNVILIYFFYLIVILIVLIDGDYWVELLFYFYF